MSAKNEKDAIGSSPKVAEGSYTVEMKKMEPAAQESDDGEITERDNQNT